MKRRKWLLIGLLLLIGLAGAIYGFKDTLFPQPRPHQDIADALAEYGWEVIDLEVDTARRIIRIAVIPPEPKEIKTCGDDGECEVQYDYSDYINGFFYILEWADEIIKPPLDHKGNPHRGVYPGVLVIGELTAEGPRVLLSNGKIAQAYGLNRVMTLAWQGLNMFLSDDADGKPWREFFVTPDKIHWGIYQLSWFGLGYYANYPSPEAYEVLSNGWYPAPEKVEPLEEGS